MLLFALYLLAGPCSYLSLAEFRRGMSDVLRGVSAAETRLLLDTFDDGDGRIEYKEFLSIATKPPYAAAK